MTNFLGSGIQSQLVGKAETTYGVAPSLAGATSWEFKSETLEGKKNTVQGQGLHAGGLYDRSGRRVLTNWTAGGGVNMDLQARKLNLLLKSMMGSTDQSVYSSNGALTQLGASTVFQAIHVPGNMGNASYTFQKGVPATDGTVEPFTYVGCKCSDWTITVETGAIAQLALTYLARNELGGVGNADPLNTAVPSLATWTNTAQDVFHFREANLITGTPSTTSHVTTLGSTSTVSTVRSASVKQTVSYDTSRIFLGGNGFISEPIENNFRKITGSFVVEFQSNQAQYEAYAADTATSLQLTFTGPTIGTSGTNTELLQILIPNLKLDGESPKVGGPAVVTQSLSFTGLDDEINNPIQITYQTLDSTDA